MNGFRRRWTTTFLILGVVALGWLAHAQRGRGPRQGDPNAGGMPSFGSRNRDPRAGVPDWNVDERFRGDVFTFVRLEYPSSGRGGWRIDFPGADLNLSYRLEQLSSMKVDPDALHMPIDDPRLPDYPFVFMIDPRSLDLSLEDAVILRKYLMGGGFLLVDDFWGNGMWNHLMGEMAKVFPDRNWVSLPLDHPIFNVPYPVKMRPQVPSEDSAHRTKDMPAPFRTWEDEISWEEPQPSDYRAFLDDKGRIMVLVCWNTDLSDGWEEEGVSQWFFETYSEKMSYPMGVNIIFHALTH
ncbi:MAG: DUF4159 domain-containing protein [Verrucomicrobiales bacterium]|nr:DUF4159 domain-containing protein [Verrucomicrobiales bacterium]